MLPESLTVYHLVSPLVRPYVLSFGPINHFDSFVAVAQFADGSSTFGETTPLPGYSHETADLIRGELTRLVRDGDFTAFFERNRDNPFVTAPILTCLDTTRLEATSGHVELCPILQWDKIEQIPAAVVYLARAGNRVMKVKLTANLEECRTVIAQTQPAGAACGVLFRYDANQALAPASAATVVKLLDHPTTELLEQPFGIDAWDDMAALHRISPVPLMLDESIFDDNDVRRAAGCAALVKFKLAKNGSPARVLRLIELARNLGLDVILGNGVQGTIGCVLEGSLQLQARLTRPGEMNGYRKIRHDPLAFLVQNTPTGFHPATALSAREIRPVLAAHTAEVFEIPTHGNTGDSWHLSVA